MIIGYSRISTQRQSDGTSLDNQKQKITEYCNLHDLQLTNVFSEIDSGGNDDRKVLTEIKNMIENPFLKEPPIKTIIVFKLDRLGRTMLGSLQFIDFCRKNNVNVVSIQDNIDTNEPKSELILNILLSIATEERRVIKERLSMGRDFKFKQNQIPYPKIPFGYQRKNKTILPDNNSEIVKYIFKKWNFLLKLKHLTKTKRTQRLLNLLKQRGYTFNGRDFKWWNIRDILNNKMYCGEISWKGMSAQSSYPTIVSKRLYNSIHH
jgi:DNA invertase Pin-like site-specific DNA recombinase